MPDSDSHLVPRNKADFKRLARDVVLLLAMGASAYGGTTAANESRLDRVESKVERIEVQVDRLVEFKRKENGHAE